MLHAVAHNVGRKKLHQVDSRRPIVRPLPFHSSISDSAARLLGSTVTKRTRRRSSLPSLAHIGSLRSQLLERGLLHLLEKRTEIAEVD